MTKIKFDVAQKQYKIERHSSKPLDYSFCMDDIQVFIGEMCSLAEKVEGVGTISVTKFYKIGYENYGKIYRIVIKCKCKTETLKQFITALFYGSSISQKFSLQRMY